ncbi:MAG: PEP/pyruvate-binding domain-containing protein [Patescibacteria group bacterium]
MKTKIYTIQTNLFVRSLSAVSKKDIVLAGGKGASLGELMRARLPVPQGFVVLASAFERFLDEADVREDIEAQLAHVQYKDVNSVDRASNVIRELILEAPFPRDLREEVARAFEGLKAPLVAVRSSATAEDSKTASWAGELETYLNTTAKTLFLNIQKCWASLFSPRAIFYRHEKNLHRSHVSVAVVVQEMIQSEVAGVAFTVHPVTKDKNQMIIEAAWGLGEAVVSGAITPDSYVVHKDNLSFINLQVSEQKKQLVHGVRKSGNQWIPVSRPLQHKQKLTIHQIKTLSLLCLKAERHYKIPCDIEWTYAKNRFYILQSRPITTL